MLHKRHFLYAGVLALALLPGCTSTTPSRYVDASDTTAAVINKGRMSSADWVIISQEAAQAMLTAPLFQEYLTAYKIDAEKIMKESEASGEALTTREKMTYMKPLLMLSVIQNNTGEHIDSKLMTERLREVLFNSGKVRFTTYAAGEGQSFDEATAYARELQNDPNVNQRTVMKKGKVNAYDLSLAGVIIKQTARDGRANEISYMFSLTLTDNNTGEGVWAYTKELKRQHTQGGFGW
ncbi:MAG: hypothetical protein GX564_09565 [Oligosphaeraceae bacterium]|nr:hypothetical protein [Oligosphaeraceae bacterium]